MRLWEFKTDPVSTVISVASLVQQRAADNDTVPRLSTPAFLNMLSNSGLKIDHNKLQTLYNQYPELKNVISNIDGDEITFSTDEDTPLDIGQPDDAGAGPQDEPDDLGGELDDLGDFGDLEDEGDDEFGDLGAEEPVDDTEIEIPPEQKVGQMAQRAAAKRMESFGIYETYQKYVRRRNQ